MMTLYEFTVFSVYLSVLTMLIIVIQLTNPGKAVREALSPRIEFPSEKFVDDVLDASDSEEEEKAQFNPEAEPFQMTENPMFSHQESNEKEPSTELRHRTVSALIDQLY